MGFDISSRLDSLFHQKTIQPSLSGKKTWMNRDQAETRSKCGIRLLQNDPSFASEVLLSTNGSVSKSLIVWAKIPNKRGHAGGVRLTFSRRNEGESKNTCVSW